MSGEAPKSAPKATPATAAPPAAEPGWRRVAGRAVGIGVPILAAYLGLATFLSLDRNPRTDDASVRANVVGIAANVEGYITEVLVQDNQPVKLGDPLITIDRRPFEIALADAGAKLGLVDLEVRELEDDIRAAEAAILQARAAAEYSRNHLERIEPLLAKQFVTPDAVDKARSEKRQTEAAVVEVEAALAAARNRLGEIGDVNARRAAAQAVVEKARLNLEYCSIRSPVDGYITNFNISPGAYVHAGDQVFAVVDASRWFVSANYQETDLRRIKPGMKVRIYLMAYPAEPFEGVVQGIGWALSMPYEKESGVLPVTDPTLDWVRLAQRFPVRIDLGQSDPQRPFRMGATATTIVESGRFGAVPPWIHKSLPGWIEGLPFMPDFPDEGDSDL